MKRKVIHKLFWAWEFEMFSDTASKVDQMKEKFQKEGTLHE